MFNNLLFLISDILYNYIPQREVEDKRLKVKNIYHLTK
jgi:hypothetical protein